MIKPPIKCAVLLAAGRGARLRPHTDTTPKPLLPVRGRPTLDLYFESLASVDISHAILVTHYLADQVEQYASTVQSRFGVDCTVVRQQTLDGTASALQAAALAGQNNPALLLKQPFLLTATDYLISKRYLPDLFSFYRSSEEDIAVSIKRVPTEELASRSSIRFDQDGRILEVVEKPAAGEAPSNYSANLTYILPAQILDWLPAVEATARGEREIQSAINSYLCNGATARGLVQTAPAEWTPELLAG